MRVYYMYRLFKIFWWTHVLFVGPLIPLFWTSGDVSSGFQSQSRSLIFTWKRHAWCTFPEIHLWCNTYQPLGGQHGSQSLSPHASFSSFSSYLLLRCVDHSVTNDWLLTWKFLTEYIWSLWGSDYKRDNLVFQHNPYSVISGNIDQG